MGQELARDCAISRVLEKGREHHRAGRLAFAEACYRKILQVEPRHAGALHLLGVVAQQAGKHRAAIHLISAATRFNPQNAHYYLDLGNTYCRAARPAAGSDECPVPLLSPGDSPEGSPAQPDKFAMAIECYRRALQIKPDFAEVHYNLGNIFLWQGKLDDASSSYRRALALSPAQPRFYHGLGNVYYRQGAWADALQCYQRVLESVPDCVEAHYQLGCVHLRREELDTASACFHRVLALKPDLVEAHVSLAEVLGRQGRVADARAGYLHAIEINPKRAATYTNLASMLEIQGDLAGAEHACRTALALRPDSAEAHSNLAAVLSDEGKLEEAAESCRQALLLNPHLAAAHTNLAGVLWREGDLEGSVACCRRALTLDPHSAVAYSNLGTALADQGDLAGSLECYQRVLAIKPDAGSAVYYLGLAHLQQGDFSRGWREYELRWQTKRLRWKQRNFSQPLWNGQQLNGARILLHAEQGLGDTLQFVRYVPLVAARGGEVVLEVPTRLRRLLAGMKGAAEIITRGEPLPDFTWHCPLLSLPLAFGTELATIPAAIPYLQAEIADAEAWSQRMQGDGLRVGLVWTGNPNHVHNRQRSLSLTQLAPLIRTKGISFYALQMGPAAEETPFPAEGLHLTDLGAEQKDFADTAAIVSNLDLVISVDTSVAHLAGAMGKPVWIPLHHVPDWRWLLRREDSPWYPTARLFRQPAPGDWDAVISRLVVELEHLRNGHKP